MHLPEWLEGVRRRLFPHWFSRNYRRRLSRARRQRRSTPSSLPAYIDVFEERVLLSSVVLGSELLVNTTVSGVQQFVNQSDRSFAVTPQGDRFIAWSETTTGDHGNPAVQSGKPSETTRIMARRVDSQNNFLSGEIEVSATPCVTAGNTVVGASGSERFVVVWESTGNSLDPLGSGVFARLIAGDGTPLGKEFRVNQSLLGDQSDPSIAWITADKFVVGWSGFGIGDDQGVFTRVFDSTGRAVTDEMRVSQTIVGPQREPAVVSLPNVGYEVVWSGQGAGDTSGIFARPFTFAGKPLADEFRVNSTTGGTQQTPAVGRNGSGEILWMAWQSNGNAQDTSGWGVIARQFSRSGAPLTGEFRANQTTTGDQIDPIVVGFKEDRFAIAWSGNGVNDTNGVFVREFDMRGLPTNDEQLVNGTTAGPQRAPAMRPFGGGYTVAWTGNGKGDDSGVFLRRLGTPSQPPVVTARLARDTGTSSTDRLTNDPTVTGTLTGLAPIVALEGAFDLGTVPPIFIDVTSAISGNTFTLRRADLEKIRQGALTDGQYRLVLRAKDAAGLTSANVELQFTLDTTVATPPRKLLNNTGDPDDGITSDPTVEVTVFDTNGIEKLLATLGSGPPTSFTQIALNPPNGTFIVTPVMLEQLLGGPLADGTYTFRTWQRDKAGNDSDVGSLTFVIDTSDCGFENGLADWTVNQFGGTAPGVGSATAEMAPSGENQAVLREGNSFLVTLRRTFTIPQSPGVLKIEYEGLSFDQTDPDFVNDAFEMALVDAQGNSLVHTFTAGADSFFNITEDLPALGGTGTTVSALTTTSGTVRVDVSGLAPGSSATLVLRLVNNDEDTATNVTISCVQFAGVTQPATAQDESHPLTSAVETSVQTVPPAPAAAPSSSTVATAAEASQVQAANGPPAQSAAGDSLLQPDGTVLFTTADDFLEGELFNVNVTTQPGSVTLNLPEAIRTFPFIWVSNSGEGTVSRYDTITGKEIGRYRTGRDSVSTLLSPSRTAVAGDGSVWVANRSHINSSHQQASIVHVLLDDFVDRNGNGIVDTSTDLNGNGRIDANEVLPWDANNDGKPDDERIAISIDVGRNRDAAFSLRSGAGIARAIAIDANNDVWVGLYNFSQYEVYDGETGQPRAVVPIPGTPYGAVIDANGQLWGATRGGFIHHIDTTTATYIDSPNHGGDNYGITLDRDGIVWVATYGSSRLIRYNPVNGQVDTYASQGGEGAFRGVGVDLSGNVWVASNSPNRLIKFSFGADHRTLLGTTSVDVAATASAAVVDSEGFVWTTSYNGSQPGLLYKVDPLTVSVVPGYPIPTGIEPYNYSDMTGAVRIGPTERTGTWKEIIDAERNGADWGGLTFNATAPTGSQVRARVRAADQRGALGSISWIEVQSAQQLAGVAGRYLEVEVTLTSSDREVDPSLNELLVASVLPPVVTVAAPAEASQQNAGATVLISGQAVAARPPLGTGVVSNQIIQVLINGTPVEVLDAAGTFFARVPVIDGENRFEIQATDAFGQTTSTILTLDGQSAPPGVIDFSQFTDVTGSLDGLFARTSFNERSNVLYTDVAVRNEGQYSADAPLLVGVENVELATVRVREPVGTTPDGIPFYDYTPQVVSGRLAPTEATSSKTLSFFNPTREQFDFDLTLLAKLNQAPAFTTLPDIEALAGRSYVYAPAATDPDGDVVGFSKITGPAGMSVNPQTGRVSWSPTADEIGTHTIVLETSDGRGGFARQSFVLSVVAPPANRPPVITSLPVVSANVNAAYTYQVAATDDDGDSLTYSLTNPPTGMTIGATTGLISWTPEYTQTGTVPVRVTVTDGHGGAAVQSFVVQVNQEAGNHPPVIVSTPVTIAVPPSTSTDGNPVNLSLWSVIQYEDFNQPDANWVLSNNNTVASQVVNADPSILLSDFALTDTVIDGTWRVQTNLASPDDDYMGFVFGYQDSGHFYLFDWKQGDQQHRGFAERGMNIKVVSAATPLVGNDLWPTAGNGDRVKSLFHNTIPWELDTDYSFHLEFHPGRFLITVKQGGQVLEQIDIADDTYTEGKFGFYNYSQGDVIYTGFRQEDVGPMYTYDVDAVDPDSDALTYSLVQGPEGMTIDPTTGVINWPVPADDPEFGFAFKLGSTGEDYGRGVATDDDGNVYVTGFFSGAVDFDPGNGVYQLTSSGGTDAFVAKYDRNATLLWAVRAGGVSASGGLQPNLTDSPNTIVRDDDGHLYVSGEFFDTVTFGSGATAVQVTSAGSSDNFLWKLDSLGNTIWARRWGGTGRDWAARMALTAAGDPAVIGYFSGTVDFDPGAAVTNLTSSGASDVFVAQFDATGNLRWARNFGGAQGVFHSGTYPAIAADRDHNLIVTAGFSGSIDADPGSAALPLTAQGVGDAVIAKFDSAGQLVWGGKVGGSDPGAKDELYSVSIGDDNSIYLAGTFGGLADFDPTSAVYNVQSAGSYDGIALKLAPTGSLIWAKTWGTSSNANEHSYSAVLDCAGNLYITGSIAGDFDFDPGPGISNIGPTGGAYTLKFDAAGNFVWFLPWSGNAIGSIAVGSQGDLYTTNFFQGTLDFDPTSGEARLTSAGAFDVGVSRLSQLPPCPEVTVRVDDGRGGFDSQSFRIDVSSAVPGEIHGTKFNDLNGDGIRNSNPTAPVLINFDSINATSGAVAATGLFDSLGIRFSSVGGAAHVKNFAGSGPQTVFQNPSASLTSFPNLLIGSDHNAGRNDIFAHFVDPTTGAPTTASAVSFWALSGPGSDNLSSEVSLTAFDKDGNVIAQSLPPSGVQFAFLSVEATGIASIRFDAGAQLDVIDDFSFELDPTFAEPGLAGWTLYLDTDRDGQRDPGERYTTTDADGNYLFANLPPGEYVVREELKPGWTQTAPVAGVHLLTVSAGQVVAGRDFGNRQTNEPPPVQPNRSPAFTSTAPSAALIGQLLRYNATASDADLDPLTFDLVVKPTGMAVDPQRGTLVWIPTADQVGTHDVVLRVSDGRGGVALQSFQITSARPNSAPVITSQPKGPAVVGVAWQYQVAAQDADGDSLTFALGDHPDGMVIDPITGLVKFTPTTGQVGSPHVAITVSDGLGASTTQLFDLPVSATAPNEPPTITSTPRGQTRLGDTYSYSVAASDSNGDPLTYSLASRPDGMSISASGLVTWKPTDQQLGAHSVAVKVEDGRGGSVTQTFTLRVVVQTTNAPPTFTSRPSGAATVGKLYAYDATANDPDGDFVAWQLDTAPAGMSIDAARGTIRWTPAADQTGAQQVIVRAFDPFGGFSTQTYTLTVRAVNLAPSITSTPDTDAVASATYAYGVRAVDPEGDPLVFSLTTKPTGMAIDATTGLVTWQPTAAQLGSHNVVVSVSDGQGGTVQQSWSIVVSATANHPPVITSNPDLAAVVGTAYTYQTTATDPDGDPLLFALLDAPTGMLINENTGLISWTPAAGQLGVVTVTVAAIDPSGAGGTQTYSVGVNDNNRAPTISSQPPQTITAGLAYRYDLKFSDPDGDPLTLSLGQHPAGMTIDKLGRLTWAPGISNIGTHRIEITVEDSRGLFVTQSYDLAVTADQQTPKVQLLVSENPILVGNIVTFAVSATDNVGVQAIGLTINGNPVGFDAQGRVSFVATPQGQYAIVASARDAAGNTGLASTTLSVVIPDVTFPEVTVTSPTDGTEVRNAVDIIGTVTDDNLDFYRILIAPPGTPDDQFVKLSESTQPVVNGVLGRLNPTGIANGPYVLRVEAQDLGGNISRVDTTIGVAGDLKIGNFTLSFTDLSIPVAGIPITVSRTYDSLNSHQTDDLGYGWRLEFRDTDLRTSVLPTGEEEYGNYNPFREGSRVYVTLPGGKREGFTFHGAQISGFGNLFGLFRPSFTPDAGVQSRLSVPDVTLRRNEFGEYYALVSGGTLNYNLADQLNFGGAYTLTTKEGLAYTIDSVTGDLTQMADTNGNVLSFSDAAIESNRGGKITFERDPQGRIIAAVDPAGEKVRYQYDAKGDLVSVTDREGNITRLFYEKADRPHYLTRIVDPLGRNGVRTEYDDQGRLVTLRDAKGNQVQLVHNPDESSETIIDPLGNPTTFIYDSRGNVAREIDALARETLRTYDLSNNLLTETNDLGEKTTYTYDGLDNLLTETDPLGNVTRYTYHTITPSLYEKIRGAMVVSLQKTVTDPLGNTTTNEYIGTNLVKTTDPAGNVTSFTYDAAGNQTSITDGAGKTTSFEYDTRGHLTKQTDALGRATTFTYDTNGNQLTQTSPSGFVTTSEYDSNGRVVKTIDAEGNVTRTEYDAAGRQVAVIDALGRTTRFIYDERGQLVETIFPDSTPGNPSDNPRTKTEYDAAGRAIVRIDEAGVRTKFVYDDVGQFIETILPDGTPATDADNPRTKTEYDDAGRVAAQIDERGNRTEFEYDAASRQILVRDALGNASRTAYDKAGRVVSSIDALVQTTQFTYDAVGRLTKTTFADAKVRSSNYDVLGRVVAETDQLGRVTRFEYDALGRLTAVVDALSQRTEYGYDQEGNLVTQKDANGHITRYEYDKLGRKLATLLPLGQRSTTEYDAVGNVRKTTDFNGDSITFTYDARNRLTAKKFPDGTQVTFTYDISGRRESTTDARGVTQWDYDVRGRLILRTDPDGATIAYTYDAAGNRTSLTAHVRGNAPDLTTYAFDGLNRTSTVTDPDGGDTRYSYNAVGALTRTEFPNNTVETRSYDNVNRLLLIETTGPSGPIVRFQYTLAANGRRDSVAELGGRTVTYGYDALDRLTSETIVDPVNGDRTITYTYDPVGNRQKRVDSAEGTTTYTYDNNDRLLTETLGSAITTYTYDANGNTLTKAVIGQPTVTYDWDAENRLIAVDTDDDGTADVINAYDNNGMRVVQVADGIETRYLLDTVQPYAQVLLEYAPSGVIAVRYTYGLDLINQTRGNTKSFYAVDGLGSTRALVNAAGFITDRYHYDAFGRTIEKMGGTLNAYLFAGEQGDVATGLDYLRRRWMNSGTGRFFGTDPLQGSQRQPISLHRFLYANANPVTNIDPNGTWATPVHRLILQRAFHNKLEQWQIDILAEVDAEQDEILFGQFPHRSFTHAMRHAFQDVESAKNKLDNFIIENRRIAKLYHFRIGGSQVITRQSLEPLGRSFHALADSTSPTHIGFQIWDPTDIQGIFNHADGEANPTATDIENAVKTILAEYDLFLTGTFATQSGKSVREVIVPELGRFSKGLIG